MAGFLHIEDASVINVLSWLNCRLHSCDFRGRRGRAVSRLYVHTQCAGVSGLRQCSDLAVDDGSSALCEAFHKAENQPSANFEWT